MKTKIFILIMLLTGSLSSCKKFLEVLPKDFVSPENYFNNETELNTALVGVYDVMGSAALYGEIYWAQFEVATDESFFRQSTTTIGVQVYNYDSNNSSIAGIWRALYTGIERANILLANIDKPVMSDANRNVVRGEALFLRSYYYFLLASNFGDVPLILTPTKSVNNPEIARTPIKDVYAQILADMTTAEGLVKPITAYNYSGRVSKSAVQGILARVCLKMAGEPLKDVSKYADAAKWAKMVITSGIHSLNPSYEQIFINESQDLYDVKEAIWEVEFQGNLLQAGVNETGRLGVLGGLAGTNAEIGNSYGQWNGTRVFYDIFTPQDLRRDWNIGSYYYSGATKTKVFQTVAEAKSVGKWRREYELLTPKNPNYNGTNFPLLRYADVLLMYAEATNEIAGPNAEIINYINLVRQRGAGKVINGTTVYAINVTNGGSGYTTVPTVTLNGGGFTNAATATATILNGRVNGVVVTLPGSFYRTPPTVTISGTTGTGAVAVATLSTPTDADLTAAQTASKDALKLEIINERSRELCYEGLRRGDLIRWGIFIERMKNAASSATLRYIAAFKYASRPGDNISEKHNLFPIPLSEISLNKLLTQNPGWQ
ncbi:RagB/SusD family nutrient uptake outer membrane protein [Pedobacter mucosus]|uniref:RagB/SusD family nutrient uptake outer membrane protein n=1 Tax=Pedobacter mucosus TaxID=2895286 RepID=UPI001EE49312|nr:RagB/SusD family nutrient uptake outer membrane protein [Pedobacter mucosus]UKT64925.1 RagB/SusD family nutrient uptake outer membrane protein [Pedobacter mucosus]